MYVYTHTLTCTLYICELMYMYMFVYISFANEGERVCRMQLHVPHHPSLYI